MKDGAEQIIGKTIKGVVIKGQKAGRRPPAMQLFLLFDDGTYYEFYTSSDGSINPTSGIVGGSLGSVLHYMSGGLKPVFVKYEK